jgi:hypothetical protein
MIVADDKVTDRKGPAQMDIVEMLARAQGGAGLRNIASQVGLDENQTRRALEQLAPVIAAGLRRNAQTDQGLTDLVGALQRGDHERYVQDPASLDAARDEGNGILGHLFGSKDVSREIAAHAANETGIGASILKQLLPIIASMVMGSLSKRTREPGLQDILGNVLGGALGGGGASDGGASRGGGGGASDGGASRGGGGLLESILGGILGGGGSRPSGRDAPQSETPFDDIFGEILGGGSSRSAGASPAGRDSTGQRSGGGTAADDLLDSVLRRTRR